MQELTIRPARSSDLPQLAHLWHEHLILRQQTDTRLRLADGASESWAAAAATWLDAEDRVLLVAHNDAEALGFIMASAQHFPPGALPGVLGIVVDLVVDLHQQGGGIGRQLFAALRNWFAQQGVRQVIIRAPERSSVGQAFWLAQGAAEMAGWLWLIL
jgi:GNAT superfamily N-acetyltransferase